MKKKKESLVRFTIIGFLIFAVTIAVFAIFLILIFDKVRVATNGDHTMIGIAVAVTILFGALVFSLCDIVRRKTMIEKPLEKILEATEKIAQGKFDTKIDTSHRYYSYDGFDLIAENINILTAELSKNEILKNDFISNVSHEIKTPLAVIQNYTKMLQNENLSKEKRKDIFEKLCLQSQRLSNLITNILKLNKLENQELVPEKKEVDLAELLRVSALSFEEEIDKKGLNLECDIDEVCVESSPSLLEIVVNNLLSNAIKFTEKGKVFVSLKQDEKNAIIKIADTGCGISKETGNRIFEKFYQGDTSHSGEGNGLGLALVKRVIDIVGGEISVESNVGKGSVFTIKVRKQHKN